MLEESKITKDYLPSFPHITLFQHKDMFRVNTDTALLGKFININEGDSVLDIGTNNGALLLYASMFKYSFLVGLDINEQALELAKLNLEVNKVKNFTLIYQNIKDYQSDDMFDVIISNPPYFNTSNEKLKNQNEYLKMARHEEYLTLKDLIIGVDRNLKKDGAFYLVHIASRFNEIKETLAKYNLFIEEFQKVKDERKKNNHVILFKITRNKENKCHEKEMIIVTR